jgi:hypothetical protein
MVPDVSHADGLGCTAETPQIPDQFAAAPNGVSLVPKAAVSASDKVSVPKAPYSITSPAVQRFAKISRWHRLSVDLD